MIWDDYLNDNQLLVFIHQYNLWNSQACVGGLFSRQVLLLHEEYPRIFGSIKRSLSLQNVRPFQIFSHNAGRSLNLELKWRIFSKMHAILAILGHDHEQIVICYSSNNANGWWNFYAGEHHFSSSSTLLWSNQWNPWFTNWWSNFNLRYTQYQWWIFVEITRFGAFRFNSLSLQYLYESHSVFQLYIAGCLSTFVS